MSYNMSYNNVCESGSRTLSVTVVYLLIIYLLVFIHFLKAWSEITVKQRALFSYFFTYLTDNHRQLPRYTNLVYFQLLLLLLLQQPHTTYMIHVF